MLFECVAGWGIRGDRFFDFKENYTPKLHKPLVKTSK